MSSRPLFCLLVGSMSFFMLPHHAAGEPPPREPATSSNSLCEEMWRHLIGETSWRKDFRVILEERQTPLPHPDHEWRVRQVLDQEQSNLRLESRHGSEVKELTADERLQYTLELYMRQRVLRHDATFTTQGYIIRTTEISGDQAGPARDESIIARMTENGSLHSIRINHATRRIARRKHSPGDLQWQALGSFSQREKQFARSLVDVIELLDIEQIAPSSGRASGVTLCEIGTVSTPVGSIHVSPSGGDDEPNIRMQFRTIATGPIILWASPSNWSQIIRRLSYSLQNPESLLVEEMYFYEGSRSHDDTLAYPSRIVWNYYSETAPGIRNTTEIRVLSLYTEVPSVPELYHIVAEYPEYSCDEHLLESDHETSDSYTR